MNVQTVKYEEQFSFINVSSPQDLEIKYLRNTFGFAELDLDDFSNKTQIPKVEIYKDYALIVLDFPYFHNSQAQKEKAKTSEDTTTTHGSQLPSISDILSAPLTLANFSKAQPRTRIRSGMVYFFVGRDFLVVMHENTHPQIDQIFSYCQESLKHRQELMAEGPIFLFYRIADVLVDTSLGIVNEIGATIDFIDKELSEDRSPHIVEDISITRRNIVVFQTMIKPALTIFGDLEKGKYPMFGTNLQPFWANVLDHAQKIWERLEDSKELIEGIAVSNESILTFRTNEIVKFLTVITAFTFPFVIVNNLYSMNVAGLPFAKEPWIIWALFAAIACGFLVIYTYFKYKKWI